ncbi:ABC transporter ATP-binding protein [Consotaella aegiceratis]|uniref:ABC transporter ATP-binding protein n=1 Tax=Consotaella aegiceratis TaxID=3097961 RepID=UPI002F3E381C
MRPEPLLSVDGLTVSFDGDDHRLLALNDVSFAIPRGKTVCVVGESGCGKSLTARSILRILDKNARIDGGGILFDDADGERKDLARFKPKAPDLHAVRGNKISMIFQEPMTALSSFYTIGNQIVEAVRTHARIPESEARAQAIEALTAVGMPNPEARLGAYTFELSGGQRQRAMIAMALATKPQLLIADEPTTALDVTTQAVILDLLRELQTRLGMSMLFITHDLGVVAEIADDVVVMYLGEVVERGPAERIFNAPQHPYTQALLGAAPRYDLHRGHRLPVIPGTVPSLHERPAGCAFVNRCPFAKQGVCDQSRPPMIEGETDALCFFAGRLSDAALAAAPAISTKAEATQVPVPTASTPAAPLLAARNVSMHFRKHGGFLQPPLQVTRAVSDLTLALREGETLGLVGESGSGKSTLGRVLAGLWQPTAGRVVLRRNGEDADITSIPQAERRQVWQDIRMVFQDPFGSLNPRMNVFDIVAEPLRMGPARIKDKSRLVERVEEVLAHVGLDRSQANRYPHTFSGGQRQRIGIARALAPHPKIIIADEPVSALDVSVQAQILNLFRDLQTELGLTYLFVSHDLNVVSNVAHRVAVMYAGRVVEVADTAQIYYRPRHPYTAALLGSVLTPEYRAEKPERRPIGGHPPNPMALPKGCSFAPRCPFAMDLCRHAPPALEDDGADHVTACHRKSEISLSGLRGPN